MVTSLIDRLEAVAVQIKYLQEQTNKNLNGVQSQLTAIENATQGKDSGCNREQSSLRTGDFTFRFKMESTPAREDRGNSFPKLEFPDFDGTNLEDWVYQSERYFELKQTAESKKVRLASVYMYGKTLQWHYTFIRSRGCVEMPQWAEYMDVLIKRFGKMVLDDPMGGVKNLRQKGCNEHLHQVEREQLDHSRSAEVTASEGSDDEDEVAPSAMVGENQSKSDDDVPVSEHQLFPSSDTSNKRAEEYQTDDDMGNVSKWKESVVGGTVPRHHTIFMQLVYGKPAPLSVSANAMKETSDDEDSDRDGVFKRKQYKKEKKGINSSRGNDIEESSELTSHVSVDHWQEEYVLQSTRHRFVAGVTVGLTKVLPRGFAPLQNAIVQTGRGSLSARSHDEPSHAPRQDEGGGNFQSTEDRRRLSQEENNERRNNGLIAILRMEAMVQLLRFHMDWGQRGMAVFSYPVDCRAMAKLHVLGLSNLASTLAKIMEDQGNRTFVG